MFIATVLLIVGLILLIYGADRLVYGAASIARLLNVPKFIIGIMIMGIGTSIPELMFSTTAGLNGKMNMAVGNVLGSNITNILLIIGCVALIRPLNVRSGIVRQELFPLLLVTLLCGFVLHDAELNRLDAIILLTTFALFIVFMLYLMHRAQQHGDKDTLSTYQEAELPRQITHSVAFLWLVVGLVLLPLAAKITVDNATVIARYFGLSELIIGLTIIAIVTSLPELATSIAAAIKGEDDMVLGNIIGSNIFNILIVLGVPALLSPSSISTEAFQRDYWVMLAVSVVLFALCLSYKRPIGKLSGLLLLIGFIAYNGRLMYDTYA